MRKTVQANDVEFYKVDWGLTKNLVGPESIRSPACHNKFKRLGITNSDHY